MNSDDRRRPAGDPYRNPPTGTTFPQRPAVRGLALRASLIWRDEVMEDVLAPRKITIGDHKRSTFVIPDVGLPTNFAIVTPGNRGYLLTLGERMRGTICIDGRPQPVGDFVAGSPGGFRATPIARGDWGVIELDDAGDYKVFFQFVPIDHPLPSHGDTLSRLAITGGIAACALLAMLVAWPYLPVLEFDLGTAAEWSFRSILLVLCGVLVVGAAWAFTVADLEQQLSTIFAMLFGGALVVGTIIIYVPDDDPNVWPGPRAWTGRYLTTRLDPKPPEKPTVGAATEVAAPHSPTKPNIKTATKNPEGTAGGKGEHERARDPNARIVPPEPPKVAMFEDKNRKLLDNVVDRSLAATINSYTGIVGDRRIGSIGSGTGVGTGVGGGTGTGTTRGGKGNGRGGGGAVEGDFVTNKGPVDTGKQRPGGNCTGPSCKGAGPREVSVQVGVMSGDPGGYTEDEINRAVRARAGIFRACYQKELNRSPGIGGKIVIKFKIGADGSVVSANPTGGSTLANEAVKNCVSSNVARLKFVAKGAIANVNYPFLFSPGG